MSDKDFSNYRINGHPSESLHAYGMVTGLVNSGISLGAMTGPLLSGIIIDALSYVWTSTILAFAYLSMVSILLVNFCLPNLQQNSCGRGLKNLPVHGD